MPAGATIWAGVMLSPGDRPMAPANLSAHRDLRFWARGDGATYRVMLFLQSKGQIPMMRTFVASTEWKEHVFPFADFDTDGRDLMGVVIAAGPAQGPFAFRLDDVRFR